MLKRYDADRWAYYAATRHGHRIANPNGFAMWLDEQAAMWVGEHGGTMDEARTLLTSEHLMRQALHRDPEFLAERIRREMAPDARENHVFGIVFTADAAPGPHVGAACLRTSAE